MACGQRATAVATRSAANPKEAAGANSAIRTAITTGVAFDIRTILSGQYNRPASASCRCNAVAPSSREVKILILPDATWRIRAAGFFVNRIVRGKMFSLHGQVIRIRLESLVQGAASD